MAKLILRKHQVEAVNFSLRVPKSIFCMRVGSGKTVCAMFSIREFLNRKIVDKAIVACTKSSVPVFQEDFRDKAHLDVPLIETTEGLIKFLKGTEKICLIKHSMFEKAGSDETVLVQLKKISENHKVALAIDEAHKMQNPDGLAHEAFQRMDFLFDRVIMYTATPYSSCLSQFYGLIHLIYPKLWKSKRAFFNDYIDEITIKDPKTFRVVRKEVTGYRNLAEFRKKIEPFVYFYYPPVKIVHVEHHTQLEDYSVYNDLCRGVIDDKTQEKLDKLKDKTND